MVPPRMEQSKRTLNQFPHIPPFNHLFPSVLLSERSYPDLFKYYSLLDSFICTLVQVTHQSLSSVSKVKRGPTGFGYR